MIKMSHTPASMDICHGNGQYDFPDVLGIRKWENQKKIEKTKKKKQKKNPQVLRLRKLENQKKSRKLQKPKKPREN